MSLLTKQLKVCAPLLNEKLLVMTGDPAPLPVSLATWPLAKMGKSLTRLTGTFLYRFTIGLRGIKLGLIFSNT